MEKHSTWEGYPRLDFEIAGRNAVLVRPERPAEGRPWIWRTEFFGHEPQADRALLGKGFHVAYLDVQNLYGAPVTLDAMDAFYNHAIRDRGLARKVVLEGFSRGGLFAFNYAARHPERVSAIYADAPVCDFKSWPRGRGRSAGSPADWERLKQAHGFSEEQALAYRGNPVDNLAPLAKAGIPLLHVCGAHDDVVPLEENSGRVAERYRALGGDITLIVKPHCGHHPHSLPDPARIVNWVLRHTPGCAALATAPELTPYGHDYFQLRGGLRLAAVRFRLEKQGRVAFLGGSITFGSGWRERVGAELRRRFPQTEFHFINAGIPSLDSTPNAFRVARDVLAHGPVDLLFVEAAVNDETNGRSAAEQIRGMEGIVRHARRIQPQLEIIHLHFADPDKLALLRQGKTPGVIESHERVAAGYGNPSVDLAREVMERIHAGEFSWEKDFKDLHPSPFGHALYARSVGRLFTAAWDRPAPASAPAPPLFPEEPLDPGSYAAGRLVSPTAAGELAGWRQEAAWKPNDGAATRPGFVDVPALVAEQPGATCRLTFRGTAAGVFVASGPDAGMLEYRVDGGPWEARDLFTQWSPRLHLPWAQMLAVNRPRGEHALELRVSARAHPQSRGHAVRILHFLVNGDD